MTRAIASPLARLRAYLDEREQVGLRRRLRPRAVASAELDLAGNDYLGLARDERVVAGGVTALRAWGAGSTGSRLVTGSTELHAELEHELAAHCGAGAALAFSSGYLANLGVITALARGDTLVVSDAHNHASVIDACRLARARVLVVPHADVGAVDRALRERDEESATVVTESVFSVDGDIAPLAELHLTAREHGALLVVDEAHALGVIGDSGTGAVEAAGLGAEDDVVRTVTLSKALGAQGGAVLASAEIVDYIVNVARSFIFDTALAPACAGAALAALRVLRAEPHRAVAARRNAGRLADELGVAARGAAIVGIPLASPAAAVSVAERCAEAGVRVGCFRPPSVPDGLSRVRLAARATLTEHDIEQAVVVLRAALGAAAP